MNHEQHPTPAVELQPDSKQIDIERLQQTAARLGDRINAGIAAAEREQQEISHGTARLIGHVLGRAYGRHSALANFGRTGEGGYDELRDEYLDIYIHPGISEQAQHWIDWLGTHLIQAERKEETHE